MPRTTEQAKPLATLYIAQGTCYLAYSVWCGFSRRISFFRVPPGLALLYEAYLAFAFFASFYFLYASFGLLSGKRQVKKADFIYSSLSLALWIPPAILSFGNAATYLKDPDIPLDLKAMWIHYLWTGVFFVFIGVMNMASILYIVYDRKRREISTSRNS